MANVLTVPNSGIISFDSRSYSNLSVPDLSASARMSYDNGGGINITSYTTSPTALNRFSVDGTQGRLFTVTDALTGSLFSVNNITGLPILEVKDVNTVVAGKYNTNALVVSGAQVSVGTLPVDSTSKLAVSGNSTFVGSVCATSNINTDGAVRLNKASLEQTSSGLIFKVITSYDSNPKTNFLCSWADSGFTAVLNQLRFGTANDLSDTTGPRLYVDSTNTLAQRNDTNPQEFRLYNTWTTGTPVSSEYLSLKANAGSSFVIGPSATGSGGFRDLAFQAGGSTRMTVTSAGNVGIGTAAPNRRLTVSGSISATGSITASAAAFANGTVQAFTDGLGLPALQIGAITLNDDSSVLGIINATEVNVPLLYSQSDVIATGNAQFDSNGSFANGNVIVGYDVDSFPSITLGPAEIAWDGGSLFANADFVASNLITYGQTYSQYGYYFGIDSANLTFDETSGRVKLNHVGPSYLPLADFYPGIQTFYGNVSATQTVYASAVALSAVTFTSNLKTSTTSVTANDTYIQVIVNGQTKYLRLYDVI